MDLQSKQHDKQSSNAYINIDDTISSIIFIIKQKSSNHTPEKTRNVGHYEYYSSLNSLEPVRL